MFKCKRLIIPVFLAIIAIAGLIQGVTMLTSAQYLYRESNATAIGDVVGEWIDVPVVDNGKVQKYIINLPVDFYETNFKVILEYRCYSDSLPANSAEHLQYEFSYFNGIEYSSAGLKYSQGVIIVGTWNIRLSKEYGDSSNGYKRYNALTFTVPSNYNDVTFQFFNIKIATLYEYNPQTLDLVVFDSLSPEPIAFYNFEVNSSPRLYKEDMSFSVPSDYEITGLFSLPLYVTTHSDFNINNFWDNEAKTFKKNTFNGSEVGAFYEFYIASGGYVAGRAGTNTPQNFRMTESLVMYLCLKSLSAIEVAPPPSLVEINHAYFMSPAGDKVLEKITTTSSLKPEQIPEYTGFIPPLYRYTGWRTKTGIWAHEAQITSDMEFYPVMVRNFEYGAELKNDLTTAYEEGKANNEMLAQDFSSGGYKLHADLSIQSTQDPILLTYFSINSLQIPWGKNETYFDLTFDIRDGDFITTDAKFYSLRKHLVLKSDNNFVYLMFDSQELKRWAFTSFISQPKNNDNWEQNRVTLKLEVKDGQIEWQIQYGQGDIENNVVDSGYLPCGVYRYDFDSNTGFLGLCGVNINRSSQYSHKWESGGFLGAFTKKHEIKSPTIFPLMSIKGCYAEIKKSVQCYVGEYSFNANLAVNHPDEPVAPSWVNKDGSTIRWYLDSAFTQEMSLNLHTARDYDTLYGKWVDAEYNVTLVYYTVDRYRADINGGKYYDALVKKTFTQRYVKGSVINLNDFGSDTYDVSFYNNIQQIPFLGWDKDITAPITEATTITALYKFPVATLRYYDVDDKLYGTVTQAMTMFPVDILLEEVKQADAQHPEWWLHERPEDKGLMGRVYGFFESIARSMFGGDNIGNGANTAMREDQKKDARYIIEQLAREHDSRDAFGTHRLYFLPVVYLDINLEQLNKGAYGNEAFNVREEDNPQWHLISGTPKLNNLVYYTDVHNVYSLGNSNFTMAINFEKKMDGVDAFAKRMASASAWFGNFFGGIFDGFFDGFGLDGILGTLIQILVIVLVIALFGAIVTFIKSLFKIATHPVNKKASGLDAQYKYSKKQKRRRRK